ncbi:MAG: hypothetical protein KAV87_27265 [Desulfobacteraceae bacterium]|nr:hypothetical protein [Desulfobacteraceae bacterium]
MSDWYYWIPIMMIVVIVGSIYIAKLAMRDRGKTYLEPSNMHGLMFCSGFDLHFSTSPEKSFGEDADIQSIIMVEVFQTKYAGDKLPKPRELVKQDLRIMHTTNQIQPEKISVKTEQQTAIGHPCNESFLFRFLLMNKSGAGALQSEFEVSETQSGIKVDLKQGLGLSYSVSGRRLTIFMPGRIKVDFESHRGYVD